MCCDKSDGMELLSAQLEVNTSREGFAGMGGAGKRFNHGECLLGRLDFVGLLLPTNDFASTLSYECCCTLCAQQTTASSGY